MLLYFSHGAKGANEAGSRDCTEIKKAAWLRIAPIPDFGFGWVDLKPPLMTNDLDATLGLCDTTSL